MTSICSQASRQAFCAGFCLVVTLAAGQGVLQAQGIAIPNGSFESPKPPQGFPAWPFLDSWVKGPQPDGIPLPPDITWAQLSGVFPNTASGLPNHIDNMDGDQAAYLFSIPGVTLSQELASGYEAGKAYSLSLDILGAGGISAGSSFEFSLFYNDGAGSPVTLASAPVVYSAELFPTVTHLNTYTLNFAGLQQGDAAVGKAIGIRIGSTFGLGDGYWDVDNVRLTVVPEPTTVGLLSMAALGFAAVARRRRS